MIKQLTEYIYMDIYCKLSKCIGQTPCSYEHYLVLVRKPRISKTLQGTWRKIM